MKFTVSNKKKKLDLKIGQELLLGRNGEEYVAYLDNQPIGRAMLLSKDAEESSSSNYMLCHVVEIQDDEVILGTFSDQILDKYENIRNKLPVLSEGAAEVILMFRYDIYEVRGNQIPENVTNDLIEFLRRQSVFQIKDICRKWNKKKNRKSTYDEVLEDLVEMFAYQENRDMVSVIEEYVKKTDIYLKKRMREEKDEEAAYVMAIMFATKALVFCFVKYNTDANELSLIDKKLTDEEEMTIIQSAVDEHIAGFKGNLDLVEEGRGILEEIKNDPRKMAILKTLVFFPWITKEEIVLCMNAMTAGQEAVEKIIRSLHVATQEDREKLIIWDKFQYKEDVVSIQTRLNFLTMAMNLKWKKIKHYKARMLEVGKEIEAAFSLPIKWEDIEPDFDYLVEKDAIIYYGRENDEYMPPYIGDRGRVEDYLLAEYYVTKALEIECKTVTEIQNAAYEQATRKVDGKSIWQVIMDK